MMLSTQKLVNDQKVIDLLIIGGGVNGCGIARDAAGRGLSVALIEMNDLASATSSASTKLFHGGLRYLEYFEVGLVRKALIEREILLNLMPHISWPMRFVIPYHKDMRFEGETSVSKLLKYVMPWMKGRRPAWLIRLGLFFYDHLGGRKILPATQTIDLSNDVSGDALLERYKKAFEYSDCWVQDSRLVALNARDAAQRGALVKTRTKVVNAQRDGQNWQVTLKANDSDETEIIMAKTLVNAAGPWVVDVIENIMQIQSREGVRLVRGSHIVVPKLFNHDKAYFLQGEDGRIIFVIPYEDDFSLIGTTDHDHSGAIGGANCSDEEIEYLCNFTSNYFKQKIQSEDVVWSYSGVRPLYDDGAKSATAATRDYVLSLHECEDTKQAPLLNVFGGKITTYRQLAETSLKKLNPYLKGMTADWTASAPLPGGDFAVDGVEELYNRACLEYEFLSLKDVRRLVRCYGTDVWRLLKNCTNIEQMGKKFGAGLTEVEVVWLIENEFAQTAEDILWRRTKLGLKVSKQQAKILQNWLDEYFRSTNKIYIEENGK